MSSDFKSVDNFYRNLKDMIIIAHDLTRVLAMLEKHNHKFDESQRLRIEALAALKGAGDQLIIIREKLQGATKTNPIETDLGSFTSFNHFLDAGHTKHKRSYCYQCIKLAENWHIVEKLGMQDTTDSKTLAKSMRLCRTLKVIDWYNTQLALGRSESELTLEQYWKEQDQPIQQGLTKRQLELELEQAQLTIAQLKAENEALKRKLLVSV